MSVALRHLLVPGVALAATGVVVMGPTLVAPPAVTLAQPTVEIPAVSVENVALTSFATDLYAALEGWASFGVQVLQDFLFWAPELSAQVGNIYQALQPIISATVMFVVSVIETPGNFIGAVTTFVSSVLGIAPLTAAATPSPQLAAALAGKSPRAAAVAAPDVVAPARGGVTEAEAEVVPPVEAAPEAPAVEPAPVVESAPAAVADAGPRRAPRVAGARQNVRPAASVAAPAQQADEAGAQDEGSRAPRASRAAGATSGSEGRAPGRAAAR